MHEIKAWYLCSLISWLFPTLLLAKQSVISYLMLALILFWVYQFRLVSIRTQPRWSTTGQVRLVILHVTCWLSQCRWLNGCGTIESFRTMKLTELTSCLKIAIYRYVQAKCCWLLVLLKITIISLSTYPKPQNYLVLTTQLIQTTDMAIYATYTTGLLEILVLCGADGAS